MRRLEPAEILSHLDRWMERGFHVDSRLIAEVKKPGQYTLLALHEAGDFLSLIWQSVDETHALAPVGSPRTLRDCADRLRGFNWSFPDLINSGHQWFEQCVDIDDAFDISKFGCLALMHPTSNELQSTPSGTYYIYDGVHKSIVYAKKLLRNEIEYRPIEAILIEPRRS